MASFEFLPFSFYLTVALLLGLVLEAVLAQERDWGFVCCVVYGTVGLWYVVDLLQNPGHYAIFMAEHLSNAYWQVVLFTISYRFLSALLRKSRFGPQKQLDPSAFPIGRLTSVVVPVWLVLLCFGVSRLNGDLGHALFPTGARLGVSMWSRAAIGGGWDSLVATAAYLDTFICALFGMLLVASRPGPARIFLVLVIAIGWPRFFLAGTRNTLLAVVMPSIFAYLLLSRAAIFRKLLFCTMALVILNFLMLAMNQYRNFGFHSFLKNPIDSVNLETPHEGLGMIYELVFINELYSADRLDLTHGEDYLAHLVNFVPRAIWSNKPRVSKEYSLLRGQQLTDDFVTGTVATGLIGQGFVNFGPVFGPLAASALMVLYVRFLLRQWAQRERITRVSLFLAGLGLLPNLGREFTPLVLWPLVFGYLLVQVIEYGQAAAESRHPRVRPRSRDLITGRRFVPR